MEIIEGSRMNTKNYVYDQYIYVNRTNINNTKYLICKHSRKCKGRILLKPNKIVLKGGHNHPPDLKRLERMKFQQELVRQSKTSKKRLKDIYGEVSKEFPISKELPYRSIESKMRRARLEVMPKVKKKEPIVEIPLNSDLNKNTEEVSKTITDPAGLEHEKESQNINDNCLTDVKFSLASEFTTDTECPLVSKNLMPTDLTITSKNATDEKISSPIIITNVSSISTMGEFSAESSCIKKEIFTDPKDDISESSTDREVPLAFSFADIDMSSDAETSNSIFSSSVTLTETNKDNSNAPETNHSQSTGMPIAIVLSPTNPKLPSKTNYPLNQIYQALTKNNGATQFASNSNDLEIKKEFQESIPNNSRTAQNILSLMPNSGGFPLTLIVPPNTEYNNILGLQRIQEISETRNTNSFNAEKNSNSKDHPLLLQGLFIPFQTTSLPPLCEGCTNNWFHTN